MEMSAEKCTVQLRKCVASKRTTVASQCQLCKDRIIGLFRVKLDFKSVC